MRGFIIRTPWKNFIREILPVQAASFILKKEAEDYDLLNRRELIWTISDIIRTCEPRRKYVISLSGACGQGKTTIINNVKKELERKDDIVIIGSFDPWNYESKEALFSAMLDTIFRYEGIDYNINRIRSLKRQLGELIFDGLCLFVVSLEPDMVMHWTKIILLFLQTETG